MQQIRHILYRRSVFSTAEIVVEIATGPSHQTLLLLSLSPNHPFSCFRAFSFLPYIYIYIYISFFSPAMFCVINCSFLSLYTRVRAPSTGECSPRVLVHISPPPPPPPPHHAMINHSVCAAPLLRFAGNKPTNPTMIIDVFSRRLS